MKLLRSSTSDWPHILWMHMDTRAFEKRQIGALPLFIDPAGGVKVCLVTARGNGRWIIPKGNPIDGLPAHEVAAQEALEEAGLLGKAEENSIGSFEFERTRDGCEASIVVDVYVLMVNGQLRRWAEMNERRILRCNVETAVNTVCSPGLAKLIGEFVTSKSRTLAPVA